VSTGPRAGLLQPVDRMHHALEFRAVQQIESALFSGKHIQRQVAGFGDHSRRVFQTQIAASNRFERELHHNAESAEATTLIVDFVLRGSNDRSLVHENPWYRIPSMDFRQKARNSTPHTLEDFR